LKTLPLVLVGAIALATLAAPLSAAQPTPPTCNPGPLPGTCCPPNADCACLLCNWSCDGLVVCQIVPTCSTLQEGNWAAGVEWSGCTHVSAYACTQFAYFGGGGGGPANNFVCEQKRTLTLP